MEKETKFCLFAMVVIVLGGLLYVVLSVVSKPEPVEAPAKCIREDIGAVVLMDSTQIQDYRQLPTP